jgi:peptidoglycan hydrolase-like protein with peptidoglycan-binding domain
MAELRAPRFFGDEALTRCLDGHRIFDGSGDPPDTVKRIQQALTDLGYVVDVDGDFGPATGAAVTRYKTDLGLDQVDPVVGRNTAEAHRRIPGSRRRHPRPGHHPPVRRARRRRAHHAAAAATAPAARAAQAARLRLGHRRRPGRLTGPPTPATRRRTP